MDSSIVRDSRHFRACLLFDLTQPLLDGMMADIQPTPESLVHVLMRFGQGMYLHGAASTLITQAELKARSQLALDEVLAVLEAITKGEQ